MPELLRQLKAGGYKVVHLVPHQPVTTLPKYDEMLMQQDKLSVNNTRPESSVFHTIGEYKGSPAPRGAADDRQAARLAWRSVREAFRRRKASDRRTASRRSSSRQ